MLSKRLLLLFSLTATLWLGIWLWPNHKFSPTPTAASWNEATITTIKRLELVPSNAPAFTLLHEKDHWLVLQDQPQLSRMRADRARVEALVTLLKQIKPKRSLGPLSKEKIAEFGLDNPTARLTLDSGQPKLWTLQLGITNPTGDGVFGQASTSSDDCLLLDLSLRDALAHIADNYYDKRMFDLNPEAICRVRVEGHEAEHFELIRNGTAFAFSWPEATIPHKVSAAEVTHFLWDLTEAQALTFMTAPLVGPSDPCLSISIWTTGKAEPQTLTVYAQGTEKDFFVGRASLHEPTFSLGKDTIARLTKSAFSLRDRSIITLDTSEVKRQRLTRPNTETSPASELVIIKTDSGWQTVNKKYLSDMDAPLWRLGDLKYTAEPIPSLPNTAMPALTWELSISPKISNQDNKAKKDKEISQIDIKNNYTEIGIEFFRDPQLPAHTCWVRVAGYPFISPVPDALLEDLLLKLGGQTLTTSMLSQTNPLLI
ncbi:putative DUF4340 domain-containing protein [Desulfovibrionales bacterium]